MLKRHVFEGKKHVFSPIFFNFLLLCLKENKNETEMFLSFLEVGSYVSCTWISCYQIKTFCLSVSFCLLLRLLENRYVTIPWWWFPLPGIGDEHNKLCLGALAFRHWVVGGTKILGPVSSPLEHSSSKQKIWYIIELTHFPTVLSDLTVNKKCVFAFDSWFEISEKNIKTFDYR